MEELLLQLGTGAVLAVVILEKGIALIKWILSRQNGGKDNKQDIGLATIDLRLRTIETNHLPHIQKCLEENSKEHTDIKVLLGRIEERLK